MKIYTHVVIDMTLPDMPIVSEESFDYRGPVALCDGGSSSGGANGGGGISGSGGNDMDNGGGPTNDSVGTGGGGISGADGQGNVSAGGWGPTADGGFGWSSNPESNVSSAPGSSFGSVGTGSSSTGARAAAATAAQQAANQAAAHTAAWNANVQNITSILSRMPQVGAPAPAVAGQIDAMNAYNRGLTGALNAAERYAEVAGTAPDYGAVTAGLQSGMSPAEVSAQFRRAQQSLQAQAATPETMANLSAVKTATLETYDDPEVQEALANAQTPADLAAAFSLAREKAEEAGYKTTNVDVDAVNKAISNLNEIGIGVMTTDPFGKAIASAVGATAPLATTYDRQSISSLQDARTSGLTKVGTLGGQIGVMGNPFGNVVNGPTSVGLTGALSSLAFGISPQTALGAMKGITADAISYGWANDIAGGPVPEKNTTPGYGGNGEDTILADTVYSNNAQAVSNNAQATAARTAYTVPRYYRGMALLPTYGIGYYGMPVFRQA